MLGDVSLRPITAADDEALAALSRACPDTGKVRAFARYHVSVLAALEVLRPDTTGVVAEAPGGARIGSAFVTFGACRFSGALRPAALFHTLMVHPAHRRRGLAAELTRAAVERARERLGRGGLVFAHVQQGNEGSLRAIGPSLPRRGGSLAGGVVPVRARPPGGLADVAVRPIEPGDLQAFVDGLDAFYADHDLYPPQTAAALGERLGRSPLAAPVRHGYVAVDRRGAPIAGLTVLEQGLLRTLEIEHVPPLMRLANRFLRVLPADRVLRQLAVESAWFAPGHARAARHLFQAIRFRLRDRGHAFVLMFDPRSPARDVFGLPRWWPRTTTTLLHDGDAPRRDAAPLYPFV